MKVKAVLFLVILILWRDSGYALKIYEGIAGIEVNGSIAEDGFPVCFAEGKEGPMVDLEELFYLMGIGRYEIEEGRVEYHLNGREEGGEYPLLPWRGINLIYPEELEGLTAEGGVRWEAEEMILYIDTEVVLPGEFLRRQEERRKALHSAEEKPYLEEEWKGLTPGILSLTYGSSDIEEGEDLLTLNYVNHIFYGSSEMNISVEEGDIEVDNYRWKRSTPRGREILLGDSYINTPSDLGDSSSFRGISIFRRGSWDSSYSVNSKRVTGIAPNGTSVELYENGILRDYQIVRGGSYEFDIETTGGNRNYEVWIYKQDGEIEKKRLGVYGSSDLLDAGEADFDL